MQPSLHQAVGPGIGSRAIGSPEASSITCVGEGSTSSFGASTSSTCILPFSFFFRRWFEVWGRRSTLQRNFHLLVPPQPESEGAGRIHSPPSLSLLVALCFLPCRNGGQGWSCGNTNTNTRSQPLCSCHRALTAARLRSRIMGLGCRGILVATRASTLCG
jgi:hypothetical protein